MRRLAHGALSVPDPVVPQRRQKLQHNTKTGSVSLRNEPARTTRHLCVLLFATMAGEDDYEDADLFMEAAAIATGDVDDEEGLDGGGLLKVAAGSDRTHNLYKDHARKEVRGAVAFSFFVL